MNAPSQKNAFVDGEADAWFSRNKAQLDAPSAIRTELAQRIARHLPQQQGDHGHVLEIGCGQGANLAELACRARIRGHGVEPSEMAVDVGRKAHPEIEFHCGTADALPWADERFDLVWFGFCLYLVDRSLLLRCVAEADRVLKQGGVLAILDFDPARPGKRPYHHRPGLWSYKMDYSALFLANPAYRLMEKACLSHAGMGWADDPQERVSLTLLRKDTIHAYEDV